MTKQAERLRSFVREHARRARVLAITSGKGGVGKTSTSVNLAIALAAQDQRVAILDADLGLANVEVLLGLNSLYNLQHVVDGEKTLLETLVQGPGGIHIIPGSSGMAKFADLGEAERERLIGGMTELQEDMDFLIVDTMAGIGKNAVSFATAADEVLVVCTPEPSSIVDGYTMIKTVFQQRDDSAVSLIVNMAANKEQAQAVANKIGHVTRQYLNHGLSYHGYILRDPHVSQAVMQSAPLLLRYPNAPASACITRLAARLLQHRPPNNSGETTGFLRRFAQTLGLASNG